MDYCNYNNLHSVLACKHAQIITGMVAKLCLINAMFVFCFSH